MSVALNINGTNYFYPETGDIDWGPDATGWAEAVTVGMLQKQGGLFQLLAEVDFGSTYGLKSLYYKSRVGSPALTGIFRLGSGEAVAWRNAANSADLLLTTNGSDQLIFNGSSVTPFASVSDTNSIDLTLSSGVLSADLKLSAATATAGSTIVNNSIESDGLKSQISNSAIQSLITVSDTSTIDLTYSSGALSADVKSASITNSLLAVSNNNTLKGNVSGGSASPSDLTGTQATTILDTFTSSLKGLAPASGGGTSNFLRADGSWADPTPVLTASRAVVTDGSGEITVATTTSTEIGYVNGVTSSIQTQLDAKQTTTLTSGNILVGNGSNVAASVAMSGDITINNTGVTAIGSNKVTNSQLAQVATQTIKGRTTASTGNVEDLTATQATAILNAFTGDSGSGGVKGLVPAPASGDAAASKVLGAGGTWVSQAAAPSFSFELFNLGLSASVGSNLLTVALKQQDGTTDPSSGSAAVVIGFRSSTLTSGAYVVRSSTSALSINTVATGATFGIPNATNGYIYVYAIDNAGTIELALAGSGFFDEGQLYSTTAIGGSSTSSLVLYSTTARTNVAIRLIGRVLSNQTTSGTYASAVTALTSTPFIPVSKTPTIQRFTSGSGTYTTPAGVLYLKVTAVGGGGGGAGSGSGAIGTGGNGGNTTFGTSLLTANGGGGSSGTPGAGGAVAVLSPAQTVMAQAGSNGNGGISIASGFANGSPGASSFLGGAGSGGPGNGAGRDAISNSGSGGGAAGGPNPGQVGASGASGAQLIAIIPAPLSSTYSYAVGAAGTAGAAQSGGFIGGAGASGVIIVEEFYQ